MRIDIRGDKVKITEAIKSQIEEKLGKLDQYFENPEELKAYVVVRVRNKEQIIEVFSIEDFKESLEKVSPSKTVNIEVSLEYNPVSAPASSHMRRGSTFEEAYQRFRSEGKLSDSSASRTFKRIFALPEGSAEQRKEQIEQLIAGLEQAIAQAGEEYDINMSLQGRTMDYAAASALTQDNTAAPKAVYDPRIVGNDMGLWVMGRTWLSFVEDAEEELHGLEGHVFHRFEVGALCLLVAHRLGLLQPFQLVEGA